MSKSLWTVFEFSSRRDLGKREAHNSTTAESVEAKVRQTSETDDKTNDSIPVLFRLKGSWVPAWLDSNLRILIL